MSTIAASILQGWTKAIRNFPIGCAMDPPWYPVEMKNMISASLFSPLSKDQFTNQEAISQTIQRAFFAWQLRYTAKVTGYGNLLLGVTHLGWTVYHIKFPAPPASADEKSVNSREELTKAFVRILTGVYDLWLDYLAVSYRIHSAVSFQLPIGLSFILFPHRTLQFNSVFFERKVEVKTEPNREIKTIDPHQLQEGCLIQQIVKGLLDTFIPPNAESSGLVARVTASPKAFMRWKPLEGAYNMSLKAGELMKLGASDSNNVEAPQQGWRWFGWFRSAPTPPADPKPAEKT